MVVVCLGRIGLYGLSAALAEFSVDGRKTKKDQRNKAVDPSLSFLVAGAGLEPATFGL